jgi:hypothetical protein
MGYLGVTPPQAWGAGFVAVPGAPISSSPPAGAAGFLPSFPPAAPCLNGTGLVPRPHLSQPIERL